MERRGCGVGGACGVRGGLSRSPSTAAEEGAGPQLGRSWTGLLGSGSARASVGSVSETLPGRRCDKATTPTLSSAMGVDAPVSRAELWAMSRSCHPSGAPECRAGGGAEAWQALDCLEGAVSSLGGEVWGRWSQRSPLVSDIRPRRLHSGPSGSRALCGPGAWGPSRSGALASPAGALGAIRVPCWYQLQFPHRREEHGLPRWRLW